MMGREGPCFHGGIEYTPLWRDGPPEKPVLCNACGLRSRLQGTLDDYIPKHGFTDSSKPEEVQNCSSCFEDNTNSGSRSESQGSSFSSCTQMESPLTEVRGFPFSIEVPRKRRSILRQYYLTSTGRLHRQLLQILHEQQSNGAAPTADDDLLILSDNAMMSSNETALGAMLLK